MEGGEWSQNQVLGGCLELWRHTASGKIPQIVPNFRPTAQEYSGDGSVDGQRVGVEL